MDHYLHVSLLNCHIFWIYLGMLLDGILNVLPIQMVIFLGGQFRPFSQPHELDPWLLTHWSNNQGISYIYTYV